MRTQLVADVVGVAGVLAIVEGFRRIYPPAAFLVAGVAALAVAVLLSRGARPGGNP